MTLNTINFINTYLHTLYHEFIDCTSACLTLTTIYLFYRYITVVSDTSLYKDEEQTETTAPQHNTICKYQVILLVK